MRDFLVKYFIKLKIARAAQYYPYHYKDEFFRSSIIVILPRFDLFPSFSPILEAIRHAIFYLRHLGGQVFIGHFPSSVVDRRGSHNALLRNASPEHSRLLRHDRSYPSPHSFSPNSRVTWADESYSFTAWFSLSHFARFISREKFPELGKPTAE